MNSLSALAKAIDRLNEGTGRVISWLALGIVLVQLLIVLQRYVFGIGSIRLQESVLYLHALLFLVGASYTLLHNGHVRVDIFYRAAGPRVKAFIDLLGTTFLLLPTTVVITLVSFPYVRRSWAVFEKSRETSGLPTVFLLKSVILVFAVLMTLQGISMAIHALLILSGRETAPSEEPPREL